MFFDPEDKAVSDVDYDGFVDAICLNWENFQKSPCITYRLC
jgi:hypothetical protein